MSLIWEVEKSLSPERIAEVADANWYMKCISCSLHSCFLAAQLIKTSGTESSLFWITDSFLKIITVFYVGEEILTFNCSEGFLFVSIVLGNFQINRIMRSGLFLINNTFEEI